MKKKILSKVKLFEEYHSKLRNLVGEIIEYYFSDNISDIQVQRSLYKLSHLCKNYITEVEMTIRITDFSKLKRQKLENAELVESLKAIQKKFRNREDIREPLNDWLQLHIEQSGSKMISVLKTEMNN
ncbi:MAG: hypothetical protein U9N85_04725 [Bacteroidota bacterium]|nr:hypothetical protein [Bacteroidota bacterium]